MVDRSSQQLWWQTGVVYQVYPRSFKDSTGNGVGDLAGVVQHLDYLARTLGVDAIWLSPFYPSPMADFGYDVADYTGVHSLFGDMADFDHLLTEAHRQGLKVIIDLVPNHSSDQHPWFIESRSSRDNPRHDWYIWRDAGPDGALPNNWLSVFGGVAWEWDEGRQQYYLHSFLKEQPDLNWRNPGLRAAMFDAVRFWLERGVDGFRVDVAHRILKDPQLRDNPPNPGSAPAIHKSMAEYDSQIHLHDQAHPDVHQAFREFRQILDDYSAGQPRMAVAEIHEFDWEKWISYYGQNLDELHMPFNFALMGVEWRARLVRQVVDSLEAALPPGAWPNYVLGTHDDPRLTRRLGASQARVAAMLLLTLRGTPTLYYGDEIGMTDVPVPPEMEQDPWGKKVPGLGRDPCRTPMQWSPAPNAGFSAPETTQLWLPLAADYRQVNVERELDDDHSMLSLYRRLLAYRKATPALQWGSYQALNGGPPDCFIFLREAGDQRVLVLLNFSPEAQNVSLPDMGTGQIRVSTDLQPRERDGVDLAELVLGGNRGVIVELELPDGK